MPATIISGVRFRRRQRDSATALGQHRKRSATEYGRSAADRKVNLGGRTTGPFFAHQADVAEPSPIRALIMDSSADTLELLRQYLEFHGFEVETCNLARLRHEDADVAEAIVRARPDVVVFDIALPYETNWAMCSSLRRDPRVTVPFVLTTTNRAVVERLTGARDVIEILGKPYDLEQFAQAVVAAVRNGQEPSAAGGSRDEARGGADRRVGDRRRNNRRRGSS
jgi:CheY-like chemotaxis protein